MKRFSMFIFTICVILLVPIFSMASMAQTSIEDIERLLTERTDSFALALLTDKDSTGSNIPTYTIGDTLEISLAVNENSYVYLFSIRSTGTITQLLPNAVDPNNAVSAGQNKYFPHKGAGYSFTVEGPTGLNKLFAIATKVPLETTSIVSFESPEAFFLTTLDSETVFLAKLEDLLRNVAPQNWVAKIVTLYVGQPSWLESDKTGTLFLKGNVGYASVYINEELVGALEPITGHLRLEELPIGEHDLRVSADNHANYITTFFVNPDLTTELEIFQHPDR